MVNLEDLTEAYYRARANKRRSVDSVSFEIDYESNLVNLMYEINNRTYTARGNYAFVVLYPKPREIFATEMRNRVVHHYIDMRMRPIYDKVLSERSFNNRIGFGLHKAIATYRHDIMELSRNYTKDAWLVHIDLKGYFPNADVEIALRQQKELVYRYYEGHDKEDLLFMLETCMRADPARNCDVFVPREHWDAIPDSKSLFKKPIGTGAAIGFLCWQNAMGLYINDVILWLQSFDFMRVMVFVDDIYIVTEDKKRTLGIIPEMRRRFKELKVSINEKKFYCQHYSKGIMCLGAMLKFDREYMNNKSFERAMNKVRELDKKKADRVVCSLNSHVGGLKNRNQNRRLSLLKDSALKRFKNIVWNVSKICFNVKGKRKIIPWMKKLNTGSKER